jgi:signal transduction histidine kinase/tetratricopeptide (TPR) repeat protein
MKVSRPKRKTIFFLFFAGIGLPSLFLAYLAFRGIQNDRALVEKSRLDEHRRLAGLIIREVDENISKVEQTLLDTISNRRGDFQSALIPSLESFKQRHSLVEEVFLLENLERIHYPAAKLLFLPDGGINLFSASDRATSSVGIMEVGEQLEFQQKEYQKALTAYQQAFDQASDPQMKGKLLNAMARVQKKSELFQDAIRSYEILAQNYSEVRVADGIPLGLAARLELGSLFLAGRDSSSSIKTFVDLYRSLIRREWTLEKAQYVFFARNIENSIDDTFSKGPLDSKLQSYKNTFQALAEEEKKQRERTERLLSFQESAAELEARIARDLSESGSVKRLSLDLGKHYYLVSLLDPASGDGNRAKEIWGLLFSPDFLRDNVLHPGLRRQVLSGDTAWAIKGSDGRPILMSDNAPSGAVTVRANFEGNFPNWTLEFSQQNPRLLETFLTSRRGLYFYVFLLIAGILVFGLILTVRTVSRELELAKMKSDFVSTISHEFKSPLTSIRQLAEMLQTGRVPSEERRQEYYDVLLEQSERLTLLTDNVLNLARIEEGRKEYQFEMIDIVSLLREIVTTVQDRVRHEGFFIEVKLEDPLPSVIADRAAITQAVTNLIDNAVKYSGESKRVIVSASDEGASLHIAVRDFGIGIRKEDVDKVFERFFRGGDELTRTVKGSGLGLTLVREIVEAHQGTVYAESEPGKGSTFLIRLPLPKSEER